MKKRGEADPEKKGSTAIIVSNHKGSFQNFNFF
jgi:hypothetical protein